MRSLLIQAAKNVTGLVQHETWKLEFIEGHGSVTPLVISSIHLSKGIVMKTMIFYKRITHKFEIRIA